MLKRIHMTRQLKLMCYAVVTATIVMILPRFAFADIFGIVDGIQKWITNSVVGLADGWFQWSFKNLQNFAELATYTSDISKAFDGHATSVPFDFVINIAKTIVHPVALGVLSFVALIQLVQIASRVDSNATLPVVKEIVIFVVTMAIYLWLVNHATDLLQSIFNVVLKMAKSVSENEDLSKSMSIETLDIFPKDEQGNYQMADWGMIGIAILCGVFSYVLSMILTAVSSIVITIRTIQIYVMIAFSPLPLATLGVPEIRQWGVGFFKNFICLALANMICVVIIMIFFTVSANFVSFPADEGFAMDTFVSGFFKWITILAACFFGIIKSGSWAQAILGQ